MQGSERGCVTPPGSIDATISLRYHFDLFLTSRVAILFYLRASESRCIRRNEVFREESISDYRMTNDNRSKSLDEDYKVLRDNHFFFLFIIDFYSFHLFFKFSFYFGST